MFHPISCITHWKNDCDACSGKWTIEKERKISHCNSFLCLNWCWCVWCDCCCCFLLLFGFSLILFSFHREKFLILSTVFAAILLFWMYFFLCTNKCDQFCRRRCCCCFFSVWYFPLWNSICSTISLSLSVCTSLS